MEVDEWVKCVEPTRMLEFLRGKGSDRKFRLFAVACCYAAEDTIHEPACRHAVEISERYADGLESRKVLKRARRGALDTADLDMPGAELAAWHTGEGAAWAAAVSTAESVMGLRFTTDNKPHCAIQSALIRDIFGNPYRPVALDPDWLTSDVLALARGIYAERAFDRMPILADALQDAGCADDDVLNHCRDTAQVHFRGCWVVDLVLGKW